MQNPGDKKIIFMKPEEELIQSIAGLLLSRKEKVAVAESVTAGGIQAALSFGKRASEHFEGGIVAYTIRQKVNLLKVDAAHALACNCVSTRTASEMAGSVCSLFNTEWGIAITGYSSPVPEMNIYTLFACVAICYKGSTVISEQVPAPGLSDTDNREYYTNKVLEIFRQILLRNDF